MSSGKTPKTPVKKSARNQTGANIQNRDRDAGTALRTVYQKTVDEAVPQDLLDLLGKLD